jgi:hypothetical protein
MGLKLALVTNLGPNLASLALLGPSLVTMAIGSDQCTDGLCCLGSWPGIQSGGGIRPWGINTFVFEWLIVVFMSGNYTVLV